MNIPKTTIPLLWRVVVFLGIIVAISAAVGPKIISGNILFRDGFALYGGIGKAVIFGLITFMLLVRHNKTIVSLRPWRPLLLGWVGMAGVVFGGAWVAVDHLLAGQRTPSNLVLAHGGLVLGLALALIGIVGPQNLRLLWRGYQRETVRSVVIGALFYVFLLVVYALWRPLASLVLYCVDALLGVSGVHGTVIPPNTLMFDKFGITVAQYCSGIESIALFTGLYIVVGLMDWERLNKKRYVVIFPFALLVLCGLNILRIYGLIMAGYFINPKIAFTLFHTYAGLVFFIIYSALFWAIAYKYMVNKPQRGQHE